MEPKPYRVLVTGSRDWPRRYLIITALDLELALAKQQQRPMVVVHGACRTGADAIADAWAVARGIAVERHPALWRPYGIYGPTTE